MVLRANRLSRGWPVDPESDGRSGVGRSSRSRTVEPEPAGRAGVGRLSRGWRVEPGGGRGSRKLGAFAGGFAGSGVQPFDIVGKITEDDSALDPQLRCEVPRCLGEFDRQNDKRTN